MPYTAEKPLLTANSEQLRALIPGWGADLDPADRPAFPQERTDAGGAGAHWDIPEQQPEHSPRERSIEHMRLTPVFGTACPPKGLSGRMRRYAYARYSEARAAHWLLLLASDRVDTLGSTVRSYTTLHPDNPITETGVLAEFKAHGIASRFGHGRADVRHQWMDPLLVGAPWVVGAGVSALALRAAVRRTRPMWQAAGLAAAGMHGAG